MTEIDDIPVTLIGHPFAPIGMGEQLRSHIAACTRMQLDFGVLDIFRAAQRSDEAHFAALGVRPTFVFRSDRDATIQGLVAAGLGVAVVPRFSVDRTRADTAVIELDPPDAVRPWRVALAWPLDRPPGAAATEFIAATEEACRSLGLAPPARGR